MEILMKILMRNSEGNSDKTSDENFYKSFLHNSAVAATAVVNGVFGPESGASHLCSDTNIIFSSFFSYFKNYIVAKKHWNLFRYSYGSS